MSTAKKVIKARKEMRKVIKKVDPNYKEDERNFYVNCGKEIKAIRKVSAKDLKKIDTSRKIRSIEDVFEDPAADFLLNEESEKN